MATDKSVVPATQQEFSDDDVFQITKIGLRRLHLEVKEDSGTLTTQEGWELRGYRQ